MSLLQLLNACLGGILPVETGVFSDQPPDQYIVLTPLSDTFEMHADNQPGAEVQEVRVCVFHKGSYTAAKNAIVKALLDAELTITDRRYLGRDDDTGHHQYVIDVAKEFNLSETEE